ncbi:androgen-induced gene 1 protein isoform X5 [Ursus maritimus]|uniref:Androgen-induced gene 1 protein isoform X5 n=2 Tax=Ursus maritimus TaxID=29073 RepID=A0A8M1FN80_URSMA|nr:androgen-induced gene 1 protein isoform X5 [Ursus maritimus]
MALVPCQVLRVAILLSYCSILCNYKAIEMPSHQTYGGSWKFLTFIDLVIQAVFFGICVLTDLSSLLTRGSGNQEQERQLRKLISLRDWMLAVLAFPVGVFVVAVFWIIYAYDREMIYPKLLDNFIPGWLNHGMHTTVLPFILIEMRTSHHAYPSRSSGLAAICTFSVGYILWQRTTFLKKTADPFNRRPRRLLRSGKPLPCWSLRTFQTPGCCLCGSHFLFNLSLAGSCFQISRGPLPTKTLVPFPTSSSLCSCGDY